jgi:arylsulfatase A-like enzyme
VIVDKRLRLSGFLLVGALLGIACAPAEPLPGDVVARWIEDDPQTFLPGSRMVAPTFSAELFPTPLEAARSWRTHDVRILGSGAEGLEIERVGADPWIAIDARIDADEIIAIEVELANPGPAEAQLFWAGRWQRFTMRRMVRPSSSQVLPSGDSLFRFEVGDHHAWHGELRSLRIDLAPGAEGTSRLRAVRLYRWQADDAHLRQLALRPWKVELGRTTRSALITLPDVAWELDLAVPERATAVASYGLQRGAASPTTFRIIADVGEGERTVLFEDTVSDHDRWFETTVDLSPLAGRRATLKLTAETAHPAVPSRGAPVWGHPVIVAPRPALDGPNVIIVLLDTLRADRLSCYGHELETSPHIDAWAATSAVRFANAVAPAPWTLPSHASLFTGLDALRHGFDWWGMAPDALEMGAEIFRRHGYTTAAVTGGGVLHPALGFAQGFDEFHAWDEPDSADEVGWVFDTTRRWLRENRHRPFFLFVHTYEVHAPHRRRQPHFGRLARAAGLTPAAFELNLVTRPWDGLVAGGDGFVVQRPGDGSWTPDLTETELETIGLMYDSAVATVDAEVGALLADLESMGLAGRTVVVVTSDHGEALGEDGRAGHSYLDDYNLMVPLLVSIPGNRRVRPVIDEQVRLLDLMPTLLDVAGLEAAGPVDGRSLTGLMNGSDADFPRSAWAYAASSNRGLALRLDNRLKYVFPDAAWAELADRERLHDLAVDPNEESNLAPDDPRLDDLRATTRGTILAQHRGLRLEILNEGPHRLGGRLTGAWAAHNRVKTDSHVAPHVRWSPSDAAVFDVGPGESATLLFTWLESSRAGLEILGPDDDGRPPGSVGLDLSAVELPAVVHRVNGRWRLDEAFDGRPETGFLITHVDPTQPIVAEAPPTDPGLIDQLRALGYVSH